MRSYSAFNIFQLLIPSSRVHIASQKSNKRHDRTVRSMSQSSTSRILSFTTKLLWLSVAWSCIFFELGEINQPRRMQRLGYLWIVQLIHSSDSSRQPTSQNLLRLDILSNSMALGTLVSTGFWVKSFAFAWDCLRCAPPKPDLLLCINHMGRPA